MLVFGLAACAPGIALRGRGGAEREADRLVALVTPPSGADRVSRAPVDLSGPAMRPAVDSLTDRARFWHLDMPFSQARVWLAGQRPGGLAVSASPSTSQWGRVTVDGRAYDAPGGPEWNWDQLQLAVAPDGDRASFLRADGLVVWLDHDPDRDTDAGVRLRVAVTDGCPATDQGVVGVENPDQGDLDAALVPAGAPTSGLLCRFTGLNGDRWALAAHTTLSGDAAARLASAARQVDLAHVDGGHHGCPMDDGSAALIVLSFPGRPDTDLWLTTNGCRNVANGHIRADAGAFDLGVASPVRPGPVVPAPS